MTNQGPAKIRRRGVSGEDLVVVIRGNASILPPEDAVVDLVHPSRTLLFGCRSFLLDDVGI